MESSEKIQTFQLTKKYLAILGVSSNLMVQRYPINRNILVGYFILSVAIICNFAFVIFQNKTFWELTQSIYFTSDALVCTLGLTILVFRTNKLFESFVTLEIAINASEWASINTYQPFIFNVHFNSKVIFYILIYLFSINILPIIQSAH